MSFFKYNLRRGKWSNAKVLIRINFIDILAQAYHARVMLHQPCQVYERFKAETD